MLLESAVLLYATSIIVSSLPIDHSTKPVRVRTARGDVLGFHYVSSIPNEEGEADVFLSIPYAIPPIGDRRFKKPVAVDRYPSSPHNATAYRYACPQIPDAMPMSEDCLTLDVISPSVSNGRKYPVMVFIHGGSFNEGSTMTRLPYQGAIRNYATRGVLIVAMQYRLGLLGFFTTGSPEFPPNLGMLDQVEALKWVQAEIGAFGGDPNRVTIFGNSAGAASVSAHTYSPLSKNLFNAAIMQSGAALTSFDGFAGFTGNSEARALQLCNFTQTEWEAGQFGKLHACLINMDYKQFLPLEMDNVRGWLIEQDDAFLPTVPLQLQRRIPVMIGSLRDEFYGFQIIFMLACNATLDFYNRKTWNTVLHDIAGTLPKQKYDKLKSLLEDELLPAEISDTNPVEWAKFISRVGTSLLFLSPIHRYIRDHLAIDNPSVYVYEFTYPSRLLGAEPIGNWNPAVHSGDMPYVTGNPSFFKDKKFPARDEDMQLRETVAEAWATFAKTGHPTRFWSPVPVDAVTIPYIEFGANSTRMRSSYRISDEMLFNGIVPRLIGDWPPSRLYLGTGKPYDKPQHTLIMKAQ